MTEGVYVCKQSVLLGRKKGQVIEECEINQDDAWCRGARLGVKGCAVVTDVKSVWQVKLQVLSVRHE